MDVVVADGLDGDEAARRLEQRGPNQTARVEREGLIERFVEEVTEPMILLLIGTGVLYSIWGEIRDAITIFSVITLLIASEVFNEWRAERAVDAIADLAAPDAIVRRSGRTQLVPASDVVVGDVVVIDAGRRVPADARVIDANSAAVDESALTGESDPVTKHIESVPETAGLGDRSSVLHAGTMMVRGSATAVVVATGAATAVGAIASLTSGAKPPPSPLQRSMRSLSASLVIVAIALSTLVPLINIVLAGQPWRKAVLTGLSLAFATIPEEMPILLTMVLAVGGYRLARRQAIVRRQPAVATLGAVTVVVTDKTGTLTQNQLAIAETLTRLDSETFLARARATVDNESPIATTDPIDLALNDTQHEGGDKPIAMAFGFDNDRRRSSVIRHTDDHRYYIAVKGAPESIIAACTHHLDHHGHPEPLTAAHRQAASDAAIELADRGMRVLAFADRTTDAIPTSADSAETGLCLTGLIGFADPPRRESAAAVATCQHAGIRVIMVTGDHPRTATAIARQVGIETDHTDAITGDELDRLDDAAFTDAVTHTSVFARVTPDHKLRIVRTLQDSNQVVAVTGDGINDGPALAAADIGVAMGQHGTDIARDAADIVLADDNFATLEAGIEEGRGLTANLRKAVRFYLAAKVALLATVLVTALAGLPQPFTPLQIIVMELFMDLAASAAFVAEAPEPGTMQRPPDDPGHRFVDTPMIHSILSAGASLFVGVCGAYLTTRAIGDTDQAGTVAFIVWQFGHVVLAMHLRSEHQPLTRLGLTTNHIMNIWAAAVTAFVIVVLAVPAIRNAFGVELLGLRSWGTVAIAALLPTAWIELGKRRRAHANSN